MCDTNSIAALIQRVRSGNDPDSEQVVWDRYFEDLVRRARYRLHQGSGSERDAEDVVVSVFNSFFRRVRIGEADDIADETSLWIFLSHLTRLKLSNEYRRRHAQKRNMRRTGDLNDSEVAEAWSQKIKDEEPSHEQAADFIDWFEALLDALPANKQLVARLKFEGWTNTEIAQKADVTERTIERWLHDIRRIWSQDFGLPDEV